MKLNAYRINECKFKTYANCRNEQQVAKLTFSNCSSDVPASTDTNILSLSFAAPLMLLSIWAAHVCNICGLTQMKIISHLLTTSPLMSVVAAPISRHFSKFSKFGPETTTWLGLMMPAGQKKVGGSSWNWFAENLICNVLTSFNKTGTNGKRHIAAAHKSNTLIEFGHFHWVRSFWFV